jgi:hypothetical protein
MYSNIECLLHVLLRAKFQLQPNFRIVNTQLSDEKIYDGLILGHFQFFKCRLKTSRCFRTIYEKVALFKGFAILIFWLSLVSTMMIDEHVLLLPNNRRNLYHCSETR